jgi:hypothetical protein
MKNDSQTWWLTGSPIRWLSELASRWVVGYWMFKRKLPSCRRGGDSLTHHGNSSTQLLPDLPSRGSLTPRIGELGSRHGEKWSQYSTCFKFIIELQNFKQLNQPLKDQYSKKNQGCNVLSPLIYLKVSTKVYPLFEPILVIPIFDPLTAPGMALCVDLGPKCQNLFCLVWD